MRIFRRPGRGNTVVEYSILFGLIACVCIGSLSLMGGSISILLGGVGAGMMDGLSSVDSIVRAITGVGFLPDAPNKTGGAHASGNITITADGLGSKLSPQTGPLVSDPNNIPTMSITDYTGGGTNTTGIAGLQQKEQEDAVSTTLAQIRQLEELANSLPSGAEKAWLTIDVIPRLRTMAAAQGYAANISGLKDNMMGPYSNTLALQDIVETRNEMSEKMNLFTYTPNGGSELTAHPSTDLQLKVQSILAQAIQGTSAFVTDPNTTATWNIEIYKAYNPTDPEAGSVALTQSLQQVQADNSINQSASTAADAAGADELQNVGVTVK